MYWTFLSKKMKGKTKVVPKIWVCTLNLALCLYGQIGFVSFWEKGDNLVTSLKSIHSWLWQYAELLFTAEGAYPMLENVSSWGWSGESWEVFLCGAAAGLPFLCGGSSRVIQRQSSHWPGVGIHKYLILFPLLWSTGTPHKWLIFSALSKFGYRDSTKPPERNLCNHLKGINVKQ